MNPRWNDTRAQVQKAEIVPLFTSLVKNAKSKLKAKQGLAQSQSERKLSKS